MCNVTSAAPAQTLGVSSVDYLPEWVIIYLAKYVAKGVPERCDFCCITYALSGRGPMDSHFARASMLRPRGFASHSPAPHGAFSALALTPFCVFFGHVPIIVPSRFFCPPTEPPRTPLLPVFLPPS